MNDPRSTDCRAWYIPLQQSPEVLVSNNGQSLRTPQFGYSLGPADPLIDTLSMVLFGLALGVLLVYLGGLMAVDICSKEASGTALGIVGVASYIGAGLQDIVSGILIDEAKVVVDGVTIYNFDAAGNLWIGSAIVSLILAALVWSAKSPDD